MSLAIHEANAASTLQVCQEGLLGRTYPWEVRASVPEEGQREEEEEEH